MKNQHLQSPVIVIVPATPEEYGLHGYNLSAIFASKKFSNEEESFKFISIAQYASLPTIVINAPEFEISMNEDYASSALFSGNLVGVIQNLNEFSHLFTKKDVDSIKELYEETGLPFNYFKSYSLEKRKKMRLKVIWTLRSIAESIFKENKHLFKEVLC